MTSLDGRSPTPADGLARRLRDVQQRIVQAAARAGRSASSVTLVAISKSVDVERILEARDAGQSDFGESRAQEMRRKIDQVGPGVRWHFVGRVQRNKVKDLVGAVSLIHSMDRIELAEAIAGRAQREQRVQRVLLQVNAGDDPAKSGCGAEEVHGVISRIRQLPGLACEGLMTIPPMGVDPRPIFSRLRELRDEARERFPEIQHLSMGMSEDFEAAVEEGATIVRVGQALFGSRPEQAA